MQRATHRFRLGVLVILVLLGGFVLEGCRKESPLPPNYNTGPQKAKPGRGTKTGTE